MPDLFRFDELTWPEVSALPRTTSLVLPLGGGFDLDKVPALLASRGPVGILPTIPFGWVGSGLEVPKLVFATLVRNLVGNLLEDGFVSVHLLLPHKMDLEPGLPVLVVPQATSDLEQLPADTEKVVILPIGHTEQHGTPCPAIHRYAHYRGHWFGYRCCSPGAGSLFAGLPLRGQHAPAFIPRYLQYRGPGF